MPPNLKNQSKVSKIITMHKLLILNSVTGEVEKLGLLIKWMIKLVMEAALTMKTRRLGCSLVSMLLERLSSTLFKRNL
jgi:hypothetical protein